MDKVISEYLKEYIENHANTLLKKDTGLIYMIETKKFQEIKLMYNLFKKCPLAIN